MKKKFLAVITAVAAACICAYAFSACGGGGDKLVFKPIEKYGQTVGYSVTETTDKYGIKTAKIPSEYNGYPVTEISDGAFASCLKLSDITIPASVTKIGDGAFNDCKSLKKVNYTGDIAGWCGISFGTTSSNPVSYTQELRINDEVVTDAVIPASVKTVNGYAFYNCANLKSVSLPDTLTEVGEYAFAKCGAIESLTIPKGVQKIGDNAFEDCVLLKDINFNAAICNDLKFKNYVFSHAGQKGDGITVTIGADVQRLPNYLFCPNDGGVYTNGVTGESSTYVPKITNVVSAANSKCIYVGDYAFWCCYDLASVTLPSSLKIIGSWAFGSCFKIANITIPSTVNKINACAFGNCSKQMLTTFENTSGWVMKDTETGKSTSIASTVLQDTSSATEYLLDKDYSYERT